MSITQNEQSQESNQEDFNSKVIKLSLILKEVLENEIPKMFSYNISEGSAGMMASIVLLKTLIYKNFIKNGSSKEFLIATEKKEHKFIMNIIFSETLNEKTH